MLLRVVVYSTDLELSQLEKDLKVTRRSAYAAGTKRNHLTQWRSYLAFCLYFEFNPVPATSHLICLYCQFLSRSITPQSIRNYLSGVKLLHVMGGFEFPSLQSFDIKVTLKGIEKLAKHTPNRAPPVTPDILSRITAVSDLDDPFEVSVLCAFLFSFFLIARVSNIVPASASAFSKETHLCRGDIHRTPQGLLVVFKWTKTIQCNERRLLLPLLSMKGSPLCPVAMFDRMCQLLPAPKLAPAFISSAHSSKGIFKSISKAQFIALFRSKLALAGVSHPSLYRGHSFRRGAASFAFHCGVSGDLIQVFGDWASDAYKVYLEFSLSSKLRVADTMRSRILVLK